MILPYAAPSEIAQTSPQELGFIPENVTPQAYPAPESAKIMVMIENQLRRLAATFAAAIDRTWALLFRGRRSEPFSASNMTAISIPLFFRVLTSPVLSMLPHTFRVQVSPATILRASLCSISFVPRWHSGTLNEPRAISSFSSWHA